VQLVQSVLQVPKDQKAQIQRCPVHKVRLAARDRKGSPALLEHKDQQV
jgi:hypothetical protein